MLDPVPHEFPGVLCAHLQECDGIRSELEVLPSKGSRIR